MLYKALLVFFLIGSLAQAQDTLSPTRFPWVLKGYVRMLGMLEKPSMHLSVNSTAWLHNRLQLQRSFSEDLLFRIDLRTQVFYGNSIHSWPGYADGFKSNDESIHLNALWWKKCHSAAYTNVERLLLSQHYNKTDLTIGRQRINWGMALTWNPNDLFQSGNPFDPDYIERPGVDAIRIQRSTGMLSGIEIALARTGSGQSRGAWRYFGHKQSFDWQTIVGWYGHEPTVGFGYSTGLRHWSFCGELQSYLAGASDRNQLQACLETDRILSNNHYIRLSILFNRQGSKGALNGPLILYTDPKLLMPGKWNAMIGWTYEPSLRIQYSTSFFYTTAQHSVIVLPQLSRTFEKNWQLALLLQGVEKLADNVQSLRVIIRLGKDFDSSK
jgi:hypothetical protein